MNIEAMKQWLEALEGSIAITMAKIDLRNKAITSLRQAIAEAEKQEQGEIKRLTDALKKANAQAEHFEREWYLRGDELEKLKQEQGEPVIDKSAAIRIATALGWTPPKQEQGEPDYKTLAIQLQQQRTWVELTKDDIAKLLSTHHMYMDDFVKEVEAKLRSKNEKL